MGRRRATGRQIFRGLRPQLRIGSRNIGASTSQQSKNGYSSEILDLASERTVYRLERMLDSLGNPVTHH